MPSRLAEIDGVFKHAVQRIALQTARIDGATRGGKGGTERKTKPGRWLHCMRKAPVSPPLASRADDAIAAIQTLKRIPKKHGPFAQIEIDGTVSVKSRS